MLSHCSFLGTALYGYVALALRAKQWEDGSIMPVTVRGARGGMTRALWLRMYAAACPGHACIGTEHSRRHWEGWIHLPNAEGMCVCRMQIRKRCRRGVLPKDRAVRRENPLCR